MTDDGTREHLWMTEDDELFFGQQCQCADVAICNCMSTEQATYRHCMWCCLRLPLEIELAAVRQGEDWWND